MSDVTREQADYAIWIITVREPKFREEREYLIEGEPDAAERKALELAHDVNPLADWEWWGSERVADGARVVGEVHMASVEGE